MFSVWALLIGNGLCNTSNKYVLLALASTLSTSLPYVVTIGSRHLSRPYSYIHALLLQFVNAFFSVLRNWASSGIHPSFCRPLRPFVHTFFLNFMFDQTRLFIKSSIYCSGWYLVYTTYQNCCVEILYITCTEQAEAVRFSFLKLTNRSEVAESAAFVHGSTIITLLKYFSNRDSNLNYSYSWIEFFSTLSKKSSFSFDLLAGQEIRSDIFLLTVQNTKDSGQLLIPTLMKTAQHSTLRD